MESLIPVDKTEVFAPAMDIRETDKEIILHAELPGVKKEDIDIEIKGDSLIISGHKQQEKKEDKEKFHREERSFGWFQRVVPLPHETKEVKAKLDNGVLEVVLAKPPRSETPSTKKITIE